MNPSSVSSMLIRTCCVALRYHQCLYLNSTAPILSLTEMFYSRPHTEYQSVLQLTLQATVSEYVCGVCMLE